MSTESDLILAIRHRVILEGDDYVVIENFGDQAEIRWRLPNMALAEALIAGRKTLLLEMVADISKEAAEAVKEARHVDNLKAGRA